MRLKIDKRGRIVLPRQLRERLGLRPRMELEVVEDPSGILLRRVDEQTSLVKVDGLWVHRGVAITGADWWRLLDQGREERIEGILKT